MNEFTLNCITYQTVEQRDYPFCNGCAFRDSLKDCLSAPECTAAHNGYGVNVIFMEKQS